MSGNIQGLLGVQEPNYKQSGVRDVSCVKGLTPGQQYVYCVESNGQYSQNYTFTAMRTDKVKVVMDL